MFDDVRSRVLPDAPADLRRGCHLQGNEFNVTMKPNYETGSTQAREIIDKALVYVLELLAESVGSILAFDGGDQTVEAENGTIELEGESITDWTHTFYADQDSEIRAVLESEGAYPDLDPAAVPGDLAAVLDRIDVAYYEADAAEIGSLELNKVVGVERALDVLDITDPFALVMGDSKSDLRVMRWADENESGIAAAPEHASRDTLEHVLGTDELVFDRGRSVDVLRTVSALNQLARLE